MAKKKSIISLIYQFKSIILSNIHQVRSPTYCLLNQPKKVSTIGFLIIVSSIYCWPHSKLFLNSKASFKETSLLTSRSMICFGEILIVKIPLKDQLFSQHFMRLFLVIQVYRSEDPFLQQKYSYATAFKVSFYPIRKARISIFSTLRPVIK